MRHYLELQTVEPAQAAEAPAFNLKSDDTPSDPDPIDHPSDAHEFGATLFGEILKVHEYERQRLGQELHDSAGQLLVSLQLSVAHLSAIEENCGHDSVIEEINETVRQIDQEIRTLAFLHYPMELGDHGLSTAIQTLARGFERRTGIGTSFICTHDAAVLDENVAVALLRITQEALVNVYRHAHASTVKITLRKLGHRLELSVSDDGVGIPPQALSGPHGIGLQGMQHRVESLGGHLQVSNLNRGTRICASVPFDG
jgi:signal transduction histidine kinase